MTHHAKTIFPVIILLIATIIRVFALSPGHPPNHPDEPLVYGRAAEMIIRKTLDPQKYDYPVLPLYVHSALYNGVFIPFGLLIKAVTNPGKIYEAISTRSLDSFIAQSIISPHALFWGRLVSVFFAVWSLVAVFWLATILFNYWTALVTLILLSFNVRFFQSSILALNDIPNTFVVLLVFLSLLSPRKRLSLFHFVFQGALFGVALSVKYQSFIFVPFLVFHVMRSWSLHKHFFQRIRYFFNREFIFSLGAVIVTFLVINVAPLSHFGVWFAWLRDTSARYGVGMLGIKVYPLWYLVTIGLGYVVSFFTIIGVVWAIQKRKKESIMLLSFILSSVFFYAYISHGAYVRNFTSFLPLLVLFAAYGIVKSAGQIFRASQPLFVPTIFLIAILVSFQSMKESIRMSIGASQPYNRACVAEWLTANLPEKSKVAIFPPVPMIPLEEKRVEWEYFNPNTAFTIPELQKEEISYVIVNVSDYSAYFIRWMAPEKTFWGVPKSPLSNTLPYLVFNQLSQFTLFTCIKPWPAVDESFLIAKIPTTSAQTSWHMLPLNSFSVWTQIPQDTNETRFLVQQSDCKNQSCVRVSAKFTSAQERFGGYTNLDSPLFYPPRLQSQIIPASEGKVYKVVAEIKQISAQSSYGKDGFFRIDYFDRSGKHLNTSGSTIVSARVTGNVWQEVTAIGIAPIGSKALTVSFQSEYLNSEYDIYRVSLFESEALEHVSSPSSLDERIVFPQYIL